VQFNQPIAREAFQFEGLGLKPGAIVSDMRVRPETVYTYMPSAPAADPILPGVVSIAAAEAYAKQVRDRRIRWVIGSLLAGAFVLGVLWSYRRHSRSQVGPPRSKGGMSLPPSGA
jgi:hypothetical protein